MHDDLAAQAADVLAPGTLVIATFRCPPAHQPWVRDFHVGIVTTLDATDFDERGYCNATKRTPVVYSFGKMYEPIADLVPITDAEASLDHRGKLLRFLGPDALATFDRAMNPPKEQAA